MEMVKDLDEKTKTNQETISVQAENIALLNDIAQLCNRPDRTIPDVILLLGGSGVGKSAIVNTIHKALCGKYFHKASTGKGIAASKTLTLKRYNNCGIDAYDLQGVYEEHLSQCLSKLPNILDAAALGNEKSDALAEILEMIIGGFIPPKTSMKFLQDQQAEAGVGCLKELYTTTRKEWKVTKVVFVVSCTETLPVQLVECLQQVLELYDKRTGCQKFDVDVFVVITKLDLVDDQNNFPSSASLRNITMKQFEEKEREVAEYFSIEGALEHNRIRWVSYVDGHSTENLYIENIALKFVKQMMQPGRSCAASENEPEVVLTSEVEQRRRQKNSWFRTLLEFKRFQHLTVALFSFFLFVIYYLLSKNVPVDT